MNYSEVRRNIWSNSVSNYIRTGLGMLVGLGTFRMLYRGLNHEQFGFWSLLWSVFGYGILLDFGFGFSAQKRVAELSLKKEWKQLSQVLSTILMFYMFVGAILAAVTLAASEKLVGAFGVSMENMREFRSILVVFFIGIALAFPMGIFPEILRGQQRIRLVNNLVSAAMLIRLILISIAVVWKWSFMAIMVIALGSALAPDFAAAYFAIRSIPEVRLRPAEFSFRLIRETMQFSLFAYLGTATNIVLGKTDQLVLGATLSVGAVGTYQAGAKIAEVFGQFTRQIQETLSPAAAHLHASGDKAAMRDLLVNSIRWSVIIATPLYLLCAFYLDELLQLLTGDVSIPNETHHVGQVLLLWFYTTILTHSVSKRIFMMCGHERRLLWLGIGEAVANLALSVWLASTFKSVVSVAVGSLVPTLFFGWALIWPWISRETRMSPWKLFQAVVAPSWIACLPMLVILIILKQVSPWPGVSVMARMFMEATIAGVVGLAGAYQVALSREEREALHARMVPRVHIFKRKVS